MLKNSMSFTITISSYSTSKRASLTMVERSAEYPLVRNCRALSARPGVRNSPSRCRILTQVPEHLAHQIGDRPFFRALPSSSPSDSSPSR